MNFEATLIMRKGETTKEMCEAFDLMLSTTKPNKHTGEYNLKIR